MEKGKTTKDGMDLDDEEINSWESRHDESNENVEMKVSDLSI